MHASTKQLLSLRDKEPVAAEVQRHLAECEQCQRELRQLQTVRNILRQVPELSGAGNGSDLNSAWDQIKQRAQTRRQHRRQRLGQWLVAASVAVIAIIAVPLLNTDTVNDDNQPPVATNDMQLLQERLIARNAQLENALRELPAPPKVMRGGTAYAIASFEDQIALMDYELSYGEEVGIDDARSVSLLQNRAGLLDSLYKVRYTQAMAALASY